MQVSRVVMAWWAALSLTAQAVPETPRSVVDDFVAAWNSHDGRNFEPLFTEDAWWVPLVEVRLAGRDRIVADLRQAHATWAGRTTLSSSDVEVTPLCESAAVVLFKAPFLDRQGLRIDPPNALMLVVVKAAQGWRIQAGQLSKPGQTASAPTEGRR